MKRSTLLSARLGALLALAGASPVHAQTPSSGPDGIQAIRSIASRSQCAAHNWTARGVAPRSYIEGVTPVFARAVCQPQRTDVQVVSAPVKPDGDDALAVDQTAFQASNMRNDKAGVDTLRHSYTLLTGLGMMESAGK